MNCFVNLVEIQQGEQAAHLRKKKKKRLFPNQAKQNYVKSKSCCCLTFEFFSTQEIRKIKFIIEELAVGDSNKVHNLI